MVNKAVYKIEQGSLALQRDFPGQYRVIPSKPSLGNWMERHHFFAMELDLIVLANAYAANTVGYARVSIEAANQTFEIDVFGERRWVRSSDNNLTQACRSHSLSCP